MSTQHYLIGSKVNNIKGLYTHVQPGNLTVYKGPTFIGCDYDFENCENMLQTNNPMQVFLIGSTSFPLNLFLHEETFLRRYPRTAKFLKDADKGTETQQYCIHRTKNNIHFYIINLYKTHTPTLTLNI